MDDMFTPAYDTFLRINEAAKAEHSRLIPLVGGTEATSEIIASLLLCAALVGNAGGLTEEQFLALAKTNWGTAEKVRLSTPPRVES